MAGTQDCPEMEVTIRSKKLVKPSSSTPQNLRSLPISSLDQLAYPLYARVILYYIANHGADKELCERKRQLEESLRRILNLYYPLAGRYISDKLMIDCNDEGAELLHATVNCNLSRLLTGNVRAQELNLLVSSGFESPSTPLLIVQLNVFACGGMAIGFTYSHRIIDGFTISRFIHAWSIACSQGIDQAPCPSFLLGSLFPARDKLPVVFPAPGKKEGVKVVTRRFLFTKEAIKALKAMARGGNANCRGSLGKKISRVVVVMALLWMAHIETLQAKNKGNLAPCLLTLPADLRDKIRIPMLPSSCGNLVIHSNAKFVPVIGKCNVDYPELLHLLHDSIRSTINQCAEFRTGDDLVVG